MYNDIPEDLKMLVEPIVDEFECELVDIIVQRGASDGLMRVVIDHVNGDGRVPLENIVSISREVEVQLDAADFMNNRYRLEVTSPGLDRILGREKDFVAALGSEIKLLTRRPIESRKRFKGTLLGFEDGKARIEVDNNEVLIPFGEVEKANSIYQFSRDDFAGQEDAGNASK